MNVAAERADAAGSLQRLRALVGAVPDPEIPVITLGDLGIVREVAFDGEQPVISLTPTYSGCPATEAIRAQVAQTVRDAGFPEPRVDIVLAPAWSTTWISERGRQKLLAYGIAPPLDDDLRAQRADRPPAAAAVRVVGWHAKPACPQCGARTVEQLSAYGSTPCKSLYRCLRCREPFDYFKPY